MCICMYVDAITSKLYCFFVCKCVSILRFVTTLLSYNRFGWDANREWLP